MTGLQSELIVEKAMAATDLADLGPDGWQTGLEHLIDDVGSQIGDADGSLQRIEAILVRRLMSRLEIEEWYRCGRDPPPAVQGPMVIIGLPRSATTALHYLLSTDPQFRYPRLWEMTEPVPPPNPENEHSDARRMTIGERDGGVQHISSVDGPTEDGMLHALNFGGQEMAFPAPEYMTWWRRRDMSSTFAYHERVLRLLHSSHPPHRWLLKAPAYLFHLESMRHRYPDVRFVVTHRDPTVAIPSACSVVHDARRMVLPDRAQDRLKLGQELVQHLSQGMDQAMAARTILGSDRFLDIGQRQVETDPVGSAERIYQFAGLDLSAQVADRMASWAMANQRGSRGSHDYSLEQYGLSARTIHEAFADYVERFGEFITDEG